MPKRPTVTVYLSGGVIQDIKANGAARVVVIDYDTDGAEPSRVVRANAARDAEDDHFRYAQTFDRDGADLGEDTGYAAIAPDERGARRAA